MFAHINDLKNCIDQRFCLYFWGYPCQKDLQVGVCDNLAGDNLMRHIHWQARKINNFDLPSLVLKQRQKSFVMSLKQLKKQLKDLFPKVPKSHF